MRSSYWILSAALAATVVAGGLRARAMLERPGHPWSPPALVFRTTSDALRDDVTEAGVDDRAMSVVITSLTDRGRRALAERLDYAAARLEAQLSPLDIDFGDGDPIEELEDELRPYASSLIAARNLVRTSWRSGEFVLRWVTRCEDAQLDEGERCAPVWTTEDAPSIDPQLSRARFAAWTWGNAWHLRLPSADASARLATELRAHLGGPTSTIALVLLASDLDFRPRAERNIVTVAARRLGIAMAAHRRRESTSFDALGREPAASSPPVTTDFPDTDVLVIPRLSAVAKPQALRDELEPVLRSARRRDEDAKILRRPR